MRRLHRFLLLHPQDQRLVLHAAALFILLGLGIKWVRFHRLLRLVARASRSDARQTNGAGALTLQRGVWAVRAAARAIPRARCLTQALVGRVLLGRQGLPVNLRIGVRTDDGFEAHAWIECAGRAILGSGSTPGAAFRDFTTLRSGMHAGDPFDPIHRREED